jgi:tetratricopeptide (TPR) repeat protein
MTKTIRRTTLGIALLTVILCGSAVGAADSFYLELLREGIRSSEVGRHEEAVHKLRIACFGFLDEPELLARGLVRLAMAQAAIDDRPGFRESFDRLTNVEERFGAYRRADLSAAERRDFESRAAAWVPEVELRRIPVFAATAARASDSMLDDLPARQLRKALRQQLQSDPENTDFLWQLADLEWREGKARQAASFVDRLLLQAPDHRLGLCLRGLIGERKRDCDAARVGLPSCADLRSNPTIAAFLLLCMSEGEQWDEARAFVDTLNPDVRSQSQISQLVATLPSPEMSDDGGSESELIESADQSAPDIPAQEEKAAADREGASASLPAADRSRLEEGRQLLLSASRLEDLDAPQQLASELVTKYPDSQEVRHFAAEVAYRGSRWNDAISHFQYLGPPNTDESLLVFYYAVSLFEGGAREEAIPVLRSVLPLIERTSFVDSYAQRILGPDGVAN